MTARFSLARTYNRSRAVMCPLLPDMHVCTRVQLCTRVFVFDKRAAMENSGRGQVHQSGPKSGLTSARYSSGRVVPQTASDAIVRRSDFVYECSLTTLMHIYPAALSTRSRARPPVTNLMNRRYRTTSTF